MSAVPFNGPVAPSSGIPEHLEEGVYQWVFGDGEEDPGLLVTEGRAVPGFLTWLGDLERQVGLLKRTLGVSVAESDALLRLRALMREVERAQPLLFQAAVEDVAQPVVAMDAFRQRTRKRVLIAGTVLALAAAILLLVRPGGGEPPKDVSAELAVIMTSTIMEQTGFGFGGAVEPTAHDRGFLVGAVIDLSRERANGSPPGQSELDLARRLASRALMGLDAPDDAEAMRIRALGGCAAIFGDDPERDECERGIVSYGTARNNILH